MLLALEGGGCQASVAQKVVRIEADRKQKKVSNVHQ